MTSLQKIDSPPISQWEKIGIKHIEMISIGPTCHSLWTLWRALNPVCFVLLIQLQFGREGSFHSFLQFQFGREGSSHSFCNFNLVERGKFPFFFAISIW